MYTPAESIIMSDVSAPINKEFMTIIETMIRWKTIDSKKERSFNLTFCVILTSIVWRVDWQIHAGCFFLYRQSLFLPNRLQLQERKEIIAQIDCMNCAS